MILTEPTAGAVACGLDTLGADHQILVSERGGGTFGVSGLGIAAGVVEVKSTNGDNHLGGDNFDKAIVDWMVAEFTLDKGIDLTNDPLAQQRSYEAGENAKTARSPTPHTTIHPPLNTYAPQTPLHPSTTPLRPTAPETTHTPP